MNDNQGLPLIAPKITPVLDPDFRPAVLANHAFRDSVRQSPTRVPARMAVERYDGSVSRFDTDIFPDNDPRAAGNFTYLERLLKFLLWAKGGATIYFAGPTALAEQLQRHYQSSPTGTFDAEIMGNRIYERGFTVKPVSSDALPPASEPSTALGRHLDGYRIGFDLGASDRKAAAVVHGEAIFSEEIPWDPRAHSDPEWHFREIMDSLQRAAKHIPRVDAIGGSSAGVFVNNRVRVASLFRGVPEDRFQREIKPLFLRIKEAWGNIPFELANDGEVTALAGSMTLNDNGVLGIAMGSSQAGGYVTMEGNITSWLNELAFAPIDYNPSASRDEWSGDYGCGVKYFSQQGVGRLIKPAGIDLPADMPLPEQLVEVQRLMAAGDQRAEAIYRTIGTYLGYGLAHYTEFYEVKYVLILGRVMTGAGGDLIIEGAKRVLQEEFPRLADTIRFHIPDEKEKRHGQAIAAASLPQI